MPGSESEQALAVLLGVAFGLLLLADLVLGVVLLIGWASGRSLLARRWSAAHVLIAFQAWMLPTLMVAVLGMVIGELLQPGSAATGRLAPSLERPVYLTLLVGQNLAMVAVVLIAVRFVYQQGPWTAGLSLWRWRPRAFVGLLAAVVVLPLNAVLERLSAILVRQASLPSLIQRGFETQMQQFLELFSGTGGLLLAILVIGIIAPIGEEVFFRGFAYRCFRTRWGPMVGGAVSAALFSLIHFHPVALLPIFLVGCVLAYLYERTGTLVAPITLHAVNNIVAVLALHFGQRI
jgi:membrane protease YdiL (CAAX protease family)